MELTILVKFEPITNCIGNEMQLAVITRGNTEEDCRKAAHKRCKDICNEIRRDNCGDPSYTWIKERWDKDVPVDLYEDEDPEKDLTGPFIDMLEELTAASALLDDDDDEDDEWDYEEVDEDDDVKDVIPFLGDDDYLFDDGSNPFEEDDDLLF